VEAAANQKAGGAPDSPSELKLSAFWHTPISDTSSTTTVNGLTTLVSLTHWQGAIQHTV